MTNRSIDPRSVLVFDIHEFGHRAGGSKEIVDDVPAPEGIGNDVIGVPTESPIHLDLRLEGVGDGVLATGVAEVQLRGECARCLTEIEAAMREAAWHVQRTEDGALVWRAPEGSGLPDAHADPDASAGLRLLIRLLGPLAPDHLL